MWFCVRRRRIGGGLLALALGAAISAPALACDPCALLLASERHGTTDGWRIGLTEEFTSFRETASSRGTREGDLTQSTNVTELSVRNDFSSTWGVQVDLPLITRRTKRIENYRGRTDDQTGIGDSSILLHATPFRILGSEHAVLWSFYGGVKLPTGSTGDLERKAEEPEEAVHTRDHTVSSQAGGRAFTFGTGSYDFPLGTSLYARYGKAFFAGSAQYTVREEGAHDYEFADDIVWTVGPGYHYVFGNDTTGAFKIALSGERKSSDRLAGALVDDSRVSDIYIGPELTLLGGNGVSGEFGVDVPVDTTSSSTVVPEYRVKAAVSISF